MRTRGPRYTELKRMLYERREVCRARLRSKIRAAYVSHARNLGDVVDVVESAGTTIQEEIELALMTLKGEEMVKINDALRRLEEGHYGCCFECGGEIGRKRLRALPFAVRCKDCEEAREDAKRREHQSPNRHDPVLPVFDSVG